MKHFLATFLIISFISISVFGFSAMYNSNKHHAQRGGCLASLANNMNCPDESNPFAFAAFHLGILKKFTTIVFDDKFLNAILIILLLVGASIILRLFYEPKFFISRIKFQTVSDFIEQAVKAPFYHWLALREKSPTIAA
ncbi:MAG: hypothetical protein QMD50_03135 [Patescibacteria group bacterium]|nr:hypothetical protein [Patescibacteria group bacterium]